MGTDCIGLREVLSGTPAVMVTAGDSGSLTRDIIECLEMGREPFRDYVPEAVVRFDVKRTAEKVQAMYEQVLR